jgi:hypothetical protein
VRPRMSNLKNTPPQKKSNQKYYALSLSLSLSF